MEDQTDDSNAVQNSYQIGDPVVDLAQGRPMVVLDAPDTTVAEWSDANNYDLEGNYANGKFDPTPTEAVVECVYVSDVRSEPSKSYTFPVSRVCLIDAHHADDGERIAERVRMDVLEALFRACPGEQSQGTLRELCREAGVSEETVMVAAELAQIDDLIEADD